MRHSCVVLSLSLVLCVVTVYSGFVDAASAATYKPGDEVIVWASKLGPVYNPHESYSFYTLPFAKPDPCREEAPSLGEVLQGAERVESPFQIRFRVPQERASVRVKTNVLSQQGTVEELEGRIRQHYVYHLNIDGLTVMGLVGDVDPRNGVAFMYTGYAFEFSVNGPHIVEANLTTWDPVPVHRVSASSFHYSVSWQETTFPFERREEILHDREFFEDWMHYFRLFNVFMMALFLTGAATIVLLRTLRRDLARYRRRDDDGELEFDDIFEDRGWKRVAQDAFAPPPRISIMAAMVGMGLQLVALIFVVLLVGFVRSKLYQGQGSILSFFIVGYSLTSLLSGLGSGTVYTRFPSRGSMTPSRTILLTSGLLPVATLASTVVVNFVAYCYGSFTGVPISTMMYVLFLWLFLSFPLTFAGFVLARRWNRGHRHPIKPTAERQGIPPQPWFLRPVFLMAAGGLLPFVSVVLEMQFLQAAFWAYKYYYLFSVMLMTFCMLVLVTAVSGIILTYIQLNSEDFRWAWSSFGVGLASAVYLWLYTLFYFMWHTHMSGALQTLYYFSYMSLFCLGVGLLCGSVAVSSSYLFVRAIYSRLHHYQRY